jgi:hypothetical protein
MPVDTFYSAATISDFLHTRGGRPNLVHGFFFFNRHYNPIWVSVCSTVIEHSQQKGFTECRYQRDVKHPTWKRTRDLERSNFRHKRPPASEATLANPAAEGGTMGEKWPRILPKVATSTGYMLNFPLLMRLRVLFNGCAKITRWQFQCFIHAETGTITFDNNEEYYFFL